jgi:Helicase HerA, central domain
MPTDFPTPLQQHRFEVIWKSAASAIPHIIFLFCLIISVTLTVWLALVLLRAVFRLRRQSRMELSFLEVTPPANIDVTPEATTSLFAVLHAFDAGGKHNRPNRQGTCLSLEIVSSRQDGIRFIVAVNKPHARSLEKHILAYIHDARISRVDDYLVQIKDRYMKLQNFRLRRHFAYPLKRYITSGQKDPLAYLLGTMSQLEPGELMAFQLVVSPADVKGAARLGDRLLRSAVMTNELEAGQSRGTGRLLAAVNEGLFTLMDGVGEMVSGPSYRNRRSVGQFSRQSDIQARPARILSPLEQDLSESVYQKLSEQLYRVNIRSLVVTENRPRSHSKSRDVYQALAAYRQPRYQGLKRSSALLMSILPGFSTWQYRHRLPAILYSHGCILSAGEIASLYHFPHPSTAKTDAVNTSLSKTLAAPVSVMVNADKGSFDVVLGQNSHHGSLTPIGLTAAERERHVYIIGGTGNGKTTMLQYAIVQDMINGKGVAVVDPHGDLAETVLRYVPADRIDDVIYFNPDDLDYPLGMNVLETRPGLTGHELLRERDLVTESVVSVFRKIFSDDEHGGHRIEYILRNAIHTALSVEDATLFTVLKLIQNPGYRRKVVNKLDDEDLKDFWRNEFGQAGNMQRVKMVAGITAKIGRFRSNAAASLILGQKHSTIDFEDIINSGKILICNFSKGLLGEDVSELFGITVLAKLQLASLRRARLSPEKRPPFYLYVDEFQNFATDSFVQMLSESRKYKLLMTLAEQSTSQQKDQRMVQVILANVGTVITFRSGNPMDEKLLLPLFKPYLDLGEIANLSTYSFYARLSAVKAQEPLSGQTLLLDAPGSNHVAYDVIEASRHSYARVEQMPQTEKFADRVIAPLGTELPEIG